MQVYTFSTGGCRDAIYLDELSSTKEGVKKLIQSHLSIEDFVVRDIKFLLDKVEVEVYDIDLGDTEYKYYELVTLNII